MLRDTDTLQVMRFWGVGSIGGRTIDQLAWAAPLIAAGLATALTLSAWPDLIAAAGIAILNADSAGDILKAARTEWRAAKGAPETPVP